MLHLQTLFAVLVVTHLVLAAALVMAPSRARREGLAFWIASLAVQGIAYGFFLAPDAIPDAFAIVAGNGLVAVATGFAACAVATFRGIRLPASTPYAYGAALSLLSGLLVDDFAGRMVAASLALGAGSLVVAALAWRPMGEVNRGTRWLFVGSQLAYAAALLGRGIASASNPAAAALPDSPMLSGPTIVAFGATLAGSLAFLLMQAERADEIAQRLASTDPLTGALNRRTFLEVAARELSRARRTDSPLSLVMLDLDHFKRVNDTYGHPVGDRVLQRFAEVVRSQLREEDILVRYGGEEFCVLLPGVPGPGAVALAGRIREAVEREAFLVDGIGIPVTTSAGVAARLEEGPTEADALLQRADEALYLAKHRGRNRVAAISLGTRVA